MLDFPVSNIGTLPGLELQIIQDKILLFLFCSIRISAFLISSPIFGAGYVLLPVRILFGMVLTLSVFQHQSDLIEMRKEKNIQDLLPGITGWAQVNGRDEISLRKKTKLDYYYLKNQTIGLDLKIIFMTIFKVIFKKEVSH